VLFDFPCPFSTHHVLQASMPIKQDCIIGAIMPIKQDCIIGAIMAKEVTGISLTPIMNFKFTSFC
jgi:hypothetical protein